MNPLQTSMALLDTVTSEPGGRDTQHVSVPPPAHLPARGSPEVASHGKGRGQPGRGGPRAVAMAAADCVLKLGGSALTHKGRRESARDGALRSAAGLVRELCAAGAGRCIVVHGAG